MASLKDLRRRVRSIKNTQMITRAMRSVAATKMRRTQDRRTRAQPYVQRLQRMVADIIASLETIQQPLLEQRERQRRLVVAFSSDRGLCGAFNNTICRFTEDTLQELPDDTGIYVIGKRMADYLRKRGHEPVRVHDNFNGNIDIPRVLEIAEELKQYFLSGEYDVIEVFYNRSVGALGYNPVREKLLPLRQEDLLPKHEQDQEDEQEGDEYLFEPDAQTLLGSILPKFVDTRTLYIFSDAFSAEHQARMLAMRAANDNCRELIDSLTLEMNKARQSSITTEILEIVSGAEALKG